VIAIPRTAIVADCLVVGNMPQVSEKKRQANEAFWKTADASPKIIAMARHVCECFPHVAGERRPTRDVSGKRAVPFLASDRCHWANRRIIPENLGTNLRSAFPPVVISPEHADEPSAHSDQSREYSPK
jgi:hypothetical protein